MRFCITIITGNGGAEMKDYIERRVYRICSYLLETGCTVRSAANVFCISKSTVHKDLTERITELNPEIARQVKAILDYNLSERHIRGGEATKKKYSRIS